MLDAETEWRTEARRDCSDVGQRRRLPRGSRHLRRRQGGCGEPAGVPEAAQAGSYRRAPNHSHACFGLMEACRRRVPAVGIGNGASSIGIATPSRKSRAPRAGEPARCGREGDRGRRGAQAREAGQAGGVDHDDGLRASTGSAFAPRGIATICYRQMGVGETSLIDRGQPTPKEQKTLDTTLPRRR